MRNDYTIEFEEIPWGQKSKCNIIYRIITTLKIYMFRRKKDGKKLERL